MRTANDLPTCRPDAKPKAAIYVVAAPDARIPGQLAIAWEPCAALNGQFHVRRGGELVPIDSVSPRPNAVQLADGRVLAGFNFEYPPRAAFALANGCDPRARPLGIKALKRPRGGPWALG
jgi:hypothetical protein